MENNKIARLERQIGRLKAMYQTMYQRDYARRVRRAKNESALIAKARYIVKNWTENTPRLHQLRGLLSALGRNSDRRLFTVTADEYQKLRRFLARDHRKDPVRFYADRVESTVVMATLPSEDPT